MYIYIPVCLHSVWLIPCCRCDLVWHNCWTSQAQHLPCSTESIWAGHGLFLVVTASRTSAGDGGHDTNTEECLP